MGNEFQSMTLEDLVQYAKSMNIGVFRNEGKARIIKTIMMREYSNMTIAELKFNAERAGIPFSSKTKKKELVDALVSVQMQPHQDENVLPEENLLPQRSIVVEPGRTCFKKHVGSGRNSHNVYTICPNCGEEIYVTYYYEGAFETATRSKDILRLFAKCPNCNAKIGLNEGAFIEKDESTTPDIAFEELHRQFIIEATEAIKESINKQIDSNKQSNDLAAGNPSAQSILSSVESLKQYILYLIHMESEIYLLTQRLTALQLQEIENDKSIVRAKKIISEESANTLKVKTYRISRQIESLNEKLSDKEHVIDPKSVVVDPDTIGISPPTIPAIPCPIEPIKPQKPTVKMPEKPSEPAYKQPGLFNKRRIQAENDALKDKYHAELEIYARLIEEYNAAQAQYEERQKEYRVKYSEYEQLLSDYSIAQKQYETELKEYNDAYDIAFQKALASKEALLEEEREKKRDKKISELNKIEDAVSESKKQRLAFLPQEQAASMIQGEKDFLQNELNEIVKARNELYKYNVIYGKYRNYVALTTLYEYLDSGRCESLEGPNGAYNLFEAETRTNEIITQLTTIATSLEAIKSNQFMLYKELRLVNNFLDSIEQSMQSAINELYALNMSTKESVSLLSTLNGEIQHSNQVLSSINTNTRSISRSSDRTADAAEATAKYSAATARYSAITAHYSAITAHYSKVNAELTDALGFMVAMR